MIITLLYLPKLKNIKYKQQNILYYYKMYENAENENTQLFICVGTNVDTDDRTEFSVSNFPHKRKTAS